MTEQNLTTGPLSRKLAIQLTMSDAVDGAMRLLGDAQRFGLALHSVRIDAREDGLASMRMTLALQPQTDAAQLCSRFARHISVLSVEET